MLKSEVIKANDELKDLSDGQISAIETLSENDENVVIGKKVGEIHGQYDTDIKEVLDMDKPSGVKTYDWLKSTILPQVKKAEGVKTELDAVNQKVTDLEKTIAENGGDDNIKQQLTDSQNKVKQMTTLHATALEDRDKDHKKTTDELIGTKLDIEFSKGITDVKFKDKKLVSESLRAMAINSSKQSVLSRLKPDWIDNGKGKKQLVFRDEEGEIQNNPENQLKPFSAGELLLKESAMKDVIDLGKKTQGAGTRSSEGEAGEGSSELDISGIKTQVEADREISRHLMKSGLERGTQAFTEKSTELRKELNVSELTLK